MSDDRQIKWSIKKDKAIAIAAILAALWAGVDLYLNVFVKQEIERAQADLAKARRVPSLELGFEYQGVRCSDDGQAVVVRVIISNPGSNSVVMDLGRLEGVDGPEVEDFSELVLQLVDSDQEPERLDYKRLDGPTETWTRVLVDANSTKTIPFLFRDVKEGVYHVEFRARLSPVAKRYLLETTNDTFIPGEPIWWSASDYVDLFETCFPGSTTATENTPGGAGAS